jgi:hypothetical protein
MSNSATNLAGGTYSADGPGRLRLVYAL